MRLWAVALALQEHLRAIVGPQGVLDGLAAALPDGLATVAVEALDRAEQAVLPDAAPLPPVYVSLTTTPERLHSPWLQKSVGALLDQEDAPEAYRVVLNVPDVQASTGASYLEQGLPAWLADRTDPRLVVHRCADAGPLTRLVASLANPAVPPEALLVVVDDDVVYKPRVVASLAEAYRQAPTSVVCMCEPTVQGFKGFAVQKRLVTPLLRLARPAACQRVDDVVVQELARHLELPVRSVAYPGYEAVETLDLRQMEQPLCSLDLAATRTHPAWRELGQDARDGRRGPEEQACRRDVRAAWG